jgi:predicted nucleotidyltransferase
MGGYQMGKKCFFIKTILLSSFIFSCFLCVKTYAQDPFPGTALDFDGVDDYVQIDTVVIPSSGNFTISVWAKALYVLPGNIEILSQNAGSGEDFYIGKTTNGNIRAGDDWLDTGVPFPTDGFWHFYTVVKETINTHLYVDGFLRASKNDSIENPAGAEFRIARQYGGYGEYFLGWIDEIRIWNIARTRQEIRETMHLTLIGNETGLVSYWQFNEAVGNTIFDPVGGYQGTMFNMDSSDWITSTVPVGGGSSFAQIISTTGIYDFTGTDLSIDFIAKTGTDTIVVSKLDLAPNTIPLDYITFDNQYWIVNKYGGGTFMTNFTFVPNEDITPEDETLPAGLRLFNRTGNSDDSWSNMMGASAASASNNSVTYDSISYFSQFLISRQWFIDINAGLAGVRSSSVAWGDYDNDNDLDILQAGNIGIAPYRVTNIYNNNAGVFTDINAGLPGVDNASLAWGDYDNDDDLDILLTGEDASGIPFSSIYHNDSGVFSNINAGLPGIENGSAAWGDYDNDGDLDILLTGYTIPSFISKIYRNDFGVFTDINAGLTGVAWSSAAWGDYDNDGDLDILLTGSATDYPYTLISRIYRNDPSAGSGRMFTDINAGLPGIYLGSVAWGDYDNDGDLDILLTGNTGSSVITRIYSNNAGIFTDIYAGLPGGNYNSTAWGDYDNDGDLDILLTYSLHSRIFRNDGGIFTEIDVALTGVYEGSLAWGDYDNDNDLDILQTGNHGSSYISNIYRNNNSIPNNLPLSPDGLNSVISNDSLIFSWNKASDNETPQDGLSYNLLLGNSEFGLLMISSMANINNGYRYIPAYGNVCQSTYWTYQIPELYKYPQIALPDYWGVQAIDHAFAGSPFAINSLNIPISLLSTSNNNVMQITNLLSWEVQFGDSITSYQIQVDDDSSFSNCEIYDTLFVSLSGGGYYYSIPLQDLSGSDSLIAGTKYYWRIKPNYTFGLSTVFTKPAPSFWFEFISDIKDEQVIEIPKHFALGQNYPNPFNPVTTIRYAMPKAAYVRFELFDITGRKIKTLLDEQKQAGYYKLKFDGRDLASGIYLYRIQAKQFVKTRKLLLLK